MKTHLFHRKIVENRRKIVENGANAIDPLFLKSEKIVKNAYQPCRQNLECFHAMTACLDQPG
jgi:hypothetical protein